MPIYAYIDRGTFVHRLHPTIKVFALFVMFWSVYWVDNPLALLPLGVLLLILAQWTGSWPNFYRLRWLFILAFTSAISWLFFYRQGKVLVHVPLMHVSRVSLVFGFSRGIKIAELLASVLLFLSTTKIEEFAFGLQSVGMPYRVGFAFSLAFRLVPLFMDAAFTIVDAQTLRGYDFSAGSVMQRARRYMAVTIPIFMAALRKANNMAMALDARGFGRIARPTTFIYYQFLPKDAFAGLVLVAIAAAQFMLYHTGLGAIAPR